MISLKIKILLLLFFGLACFFSYLFIHQDAYNLWSDTNIYADTARNFLKGNGLTSNAIMPGLISYTPKTSLDNWPTFYPPLYPLVISLFFLLFGVNSYSVIFTSGFFYLLSIPILFLLAKNVFNQKVAIYASLFYIFSPFMLDYSISGMPETFLTFLIITATYFLFQEQKSAFSAVFAGIFVCLAALTKFQGSLLLLPCLMILFLSKFKIRSFLLFFGGFFTIFFLRKFLLPKSAFDYANFTNHQIWSYIAYDSFVAKEDLFRTLEPVKFQDVLANFSLIIRKIFNNLYLFAQKAFTLLQLPVFIFFLISLIEKEKTQSEKQKFKLFVLSTFIIFSLFHIVTYLDFRYLHPILPLIMIIAANFLVNLMDKRTFAVNTFVKKSYLFIIFLVIPLLTFSGLGTNIINSLNYQKKPTFQLIQAEFIRSNTPIGSVIVSDFAPTITWFGERKAIFLPKSVKDLELIDNKYTKVDAIYLYSFSDKEKYENEWQRLLDEHLNLDNFYFAKELNIRPEDNYYHISVKSVLYLKKPIPTSI